MEVAGVIASSITLLEVSLKTVGFFQEIGEVQDDFHNLKTEVTSIDSIARDLRSIPRLFAKNSGLPQVSEPESITQGILQLEQIKAEMDKLIAYCARSSGVDMSCARKRKWILKRNKIPKLLNRARDARSCLQTGLQIQAMMLDVLRIASEKRHCREITEVIQSLRDLQQVAHLELEPSSKAVAGESHAKEAGEETLHHSNSANQETGACTRDLNVISNRLSSPHQAVEEGVIVPIRPSASFQTRRPSEIQPMTGHTCRCRTHRHQNRYRAPMWLQTILGSWRIEDCSPNRSTAPSLPNSSCDCGDASSLTIEGYLPTWLNARTLLLKVAYNSLGLTLTLRPARIIMPDEFVLSWMIYGAGPEFIWMTDWIYFPTDHSTDGRELIEIAIVNRQFSAVSFLLKKWETLLQHQRLRRDVAFVAYDCLKNSQLEEQDILVLKQVLSFVEDAPAWGETTLVHLAAAQGHGVMEALKKEPWALNTPDYMGYLPIHIASMSGNIRALEELIQMNAGVNKGDDEGKTALIHAAWNRHVGCVRLLLEHGCNIDQRDKFQATALHLAARACEPDVVSALLAAGASPSACNIFGQSPLHKLGKLCTDLKTVRQVLRLFLASGKINCDILNNSGYTPVMQAIVDNSLIAVSCFIETDNGTSLRQLSKKGCSALHLVGRFADLKLLDYFLSLDSHLFLGLDVNQLDHQSVTPWTYFQDTLSSDSVYYREEGTHEDCYAAFNQLLQVIHEQNIKYEVKILDYTIGYVRQGSIDEARSQLNLALIQQGKWKKKDAVCYYRAIIQKIQAADFEGVIPALEEDIEELNNRIGTLPWMAGSESEQASIKKDNDYNKIHLSTV